MSEIAKLRQRLKNVSRNTVEYRMTVTEARSLLAEIDKLVTPVVMAPIAETKVAEVMQPKIIDGGTF